MRYLIFLAFVGALTGGCVTGSNGNVPDDCTPEMMVNDGAPAEAKDGALSLLNDVDTHYKGSAAAVKKAEDRCNSRLSDPAASIAYDTWSNQATENATNAQSKLGSEWEKYRQIGRCYSDELKANLRSKLVDWENRLTVLQNNASSICGLSRTR